MKYTEAKALLLWHTKILGYMTYNVSIKVKKRFTTFNEKLQDYFVFFKQRVSKVFNNKIQIQKKISYSSILLIYALI